jgi:hypothetical protein
VLINNKKQPKKEPRTEKEEEPYYVSLNGAFNGKMMDLALRPFQAQDPEALAYGAYVYMQAFQNRGMMMEFGAGYYLGSKSESVLFENTTNSREFFAAVGKDLTKNESFIVFPALKVGHYRTNWTVLEKTNLSTFNGEPVVQKVRNSAFVVAPQVAFKVFIGRFCTELKFGYDVDLSSGKWRNNNGKVDGIGSFSYSGFYSTFSIGIGGK